MGDSPLLTQPCSLITTLSSSSEQLQSVHDTNIIMKRIHLLLSTCLLHLLVSSAAGLPQYKDEYDYEYDDEELNNADDSEAGPVKQYSAKMRSENQRFDVVAGTTIRMRCDIDNLNSDLYSSVMWKRENEKNTLISSGELIIPDSYRQRTKVTLSNTGSELTIGAAGVEDAGKYKCVLQLPGQQEQSVVHTVVIRGSLNEQESSSLQFSGSVGDEMILRCDTASSSGHTPRVSWSKQNGELPVDGKHSEDGSVYTVTRLQHQDQGVYVCTAQNDQDSVQQVVQVTVKDSSSEANSGSRILLTHVWSVVVMFAVLCL